MKNAMFFFRPSHLFHNFHRPFVHLLGNIGAISGKHGQLATDVSNFPLVEVEHVVQNTGHNMLHYGLTSDTVYLQYTIYYTVIVFTINQLVIFYSLRSTRVNMLLDNSCLL